MSHGLVGGLILGGVDFSRARRSCRHRKFVVTRKRIAGRLSLVTLRFDQVNRGASRSAGASETVKEVGSGLWPW